MYDFPWKAKNEKVLFYAKENTSYFLIKNLLNLFVVFWISFFVSVIIYFLTNSYLSFIFVVFFIVWYILYKNYLHHRTYLIITNKRVLKFVRNGLFSEHMKEIKIEQVNEVSATKRWFIEKIFSIWNIKISWKDKENVIWFKWVKYPKQVVMYFSRLQDFLQEKPNYNLSDLKEFIPREYRK